MNKIIKEQLNKIQVANMDNYNENIYSFIIPKYNADRFEEDKCYLIELSDSLIKNDKDSLLQCNWNRGTYPVNKYLKIDVSQIMGKMIKVNSIGFNYETQQDTDDLWEGWLPKKGLKIIQVL